MIKPLPGYVLIEPIEDESKTKGGLYLPDSTKDKPMKGVVVATSDIFFHDGDVFPIGDTKLTPQYLKIEEGSVVVYKKWTNQEVTHEGKEYLLVGYNELLAVIE